MATSTFFTDFKTGPGAKLEGYTGHIYLVPSGSAVNSDMPLTEDTGRPGSYYRENVADGEYKVYIDTDKSGTPVEGDLYKIPGGSPYLVWHGEKKITYMVSKLTTLRTLASLDDVPDYLGQIARYNGKIYVATDLDPARWVYTGEPMVENVLKNFDDGGNFKYLSQDKTIRGIIPLVELTTQTTSPFQSGTGITMALIPGYDSLGYHTRAQDDLTSLPALIYAGALPTSRTGLRFAICYKFSKPSGASSGEYPWNEIYLHNTSSTKSFQVTNTGILYRGNSTYLTWAYKKATNPIPPFSGISNPYTILEVEWVTESSIKIRVYTETDAGIKELYAESAEFTIPLADITTTLFKYVGYKATVYIRKTKLSFAGPVEDSEMISAKAEKNKQDVSAIRTSAGLNSDMTYTPPAGNNYLSTAVSLNDADKKLDAEIKKANDATVSYSRMDNYLKSVVPLINESTSVNSPFTIATGITLEKITGYDSLGYHTKAQNDTASLPALVYGGALPGTRTGLKIAVSYKFIKPAGSGVDEYPWNEMYLHNSAYANRWQVYREGIRYRLTNAFVTWTYKKGTYPMPSPELSNPYTILEIEWITEYSLKFRVYTQTDAGIKELYAESAEFTITQSEVTGAVLKLVGYKATVYVKSVIVSNSSSTGISLVSLNDKDKELEQDISDLQTKTESILSINTNVGTGTIGLGGECVKNGNYETYVQNIRKEIFKFRGDPSYQKFFLAIGFDTTDPKIELPILSKYNKVATVNVRSTSRPTETEINSVLSFAQCGFEVADYALYRASFLVYSPFYNGQPVTGGDGTQVGFPPAEHFNENPGNPGYNYFGKQLSAAIGTIIMINDAGYQPSPNPYYIAPTTTWADMASDPVKQQYLRDAFSVFNTYYEQSYENGAKLIDFLDGLSNELLGTSGSSKGSWNGTQYTGGIFTGCKTSQNHEIWERITEIKLKLFLKYYGIVQNITEWSMPGSPALPVGYLFNSKTYQTVDHDRTKMFNDFCKATSTRLKDKDGNDLSRSFIDVLRNYGFKHMHDSKYPGRTDGLSVMNIQYLSRNSRYFKNRDTLGHLGADIVEAPFDSTDYSGVTTSDWLKYLYENSTIFKSQIDRILKQNSQGILPYAVIDTRDTFSCKIALESLIRFCELANIELITKEQLWDLSFNYDVKGNLIPNPNFNILQSKMNVVNAPLSPNGWEGDCGKLFDAAVPDGKSNTLSCGSTAHTQVFGIPTGKLGLSFYSKGSGTVNIYAIKNKTAYTSKETPAIATLTISGGTSFEKRTMEIAIPDNALVASADPSYIPECEGLQDKICGLYIELVGAGLKITMPYLKQKETADF